MQQEDLNAMMRHPWERMTTARHNLPGCRQCGERYIGDGEALCVDCHERRGGRCIHDQTSE